MNAERLLEMKDTLRDTEVQVEGKILPLESHCVLVPDDSPTTREAGDAGVLLVQPGLRAELSETGQISTTRPVACFKHVTVTDILRKSTVEPFPLMLTDLSAVRLSHPLCPPLDINLVGIDKPRESEIKFAEDPRNSESERKRLLELFRERRTKW